VVADARLHRGVAAGKAESVFTLERGVYCAALHSGIEPVQHDLASGAALETVEAAGLRVPTA
jgi:hypothetical protein